MNMKRNQQDAEDYEYNKQKNNNLMQADAYFWVCRRCKTKNVKINSNCYNCAARR